MTNTALLNNAIERSGIKREKLAELLCVSTSTFYRKLSNAVEFKASEIAKLKIALNLTTDEVDAIFFAKTVNGEPK